MVLPNHPMIADVCGTLVHDDTTVGLLEHHFRRGSGANWPVRAGLFRILSAKPTRKVFEFLEKLSGRHLYKGSMLALLRGQTIAALDESAQDYAQLLLTERRCTPVTHVVAAATASGQLVLASASLEPIVAALAKRLDTPHVASQLELHNGHLTGRLSVDLTGRKECALSMLNGTPLPPGGYDMISDNFSDLSMLRAAAKATVVLRHPRHRRRWNGKLVASFLEVYERS